MKTYLDCIPCFVRQTLDSVRFITDDEATHEELLRHVIQSLGEMDLRQPPPMMATRIHRLIRKLTRNRDPYRDVKNRFNALALGLLAGLESRVANSANPLETAIRLAIAGNVIDYGVRSDIDDAHVTEAIDHALSDELLGSVDEFADAVASADKILYLADNAGEIVFDRLLLAQLPLEKVTLVVKGAPIINDATLDDAEQAGLTDIVTIIDNGSDAPGTILAECSDEFRRRFDEADIIIAKGQGNYETLSDVPKDIFFILKAKCPVIAGHLGCDVGGLVLRRHEATAATENG